MATIDLSHTEFYGRVSRPAVGAERVRPECQCCGSSLAGRSEGLRVWGGTLMRFYRCGCGREQRVEVRGGRAA
jgi:hypothetical protein